MSDLTLLNNEQHAKLRLLPGSGIKGAPLFDEQGKSVDWVNTLGNQLESHLQANYQTHLYINALEKAGLNKEINVHIAYKDGTVQTIGGLHTVDEDKLQAMDAEQLLEFNKIGYLMPIHAMLMSIYQLNPLVRRHNKIAESPAGKVAGHKLVNQVKLEIARDAGAVGHVS